MEKTDHDLLIRLDEKVENMIDEFRLLRDGSAKRLDEVERNKLERKEFNEFMENQFADHEKRLRKSERFYFGAIAIIGFVDFILLIISVVRR